jgi:hypothetical protein
MKNAIPAKGARLLRKVAKHILAEPARYNQNTTVVKGREGDIAFHINDKAQRFPECGTIACIGGWASIMGRVPLANYGGLHFRKLAVALGVHYNAVDRLCEYTRYTGQAGWPSSFRNAYNKAKTPKSRAKIAAARIEHFIKFGE